MNRALIISPQTAGKRLRGFFWKHPEWWSLMLVGLAWGIIGSTASTHSGHFHYIRPFQVGFLNWCLMVFGMMVPLVLKPLRWLAFQNFRHRRHRAILLFLIGFMWPWLLAGLIAAWLWTLDWSRFSFLASGLFGLAAVWVLVPIRQRALVFCHMTLPLAPSGWKADRDCLRYGILIGASCVVTCGFLMLACVFTGHNLLAMLGGFILDTLEFYSYRPPTRLIFWGTLLLAVWFLLPISYTIHP